MGANYHVYIGPYLQIANPPKHSVDWQRMVCSKVESHEIGDRAVFCPKCGAKTIGVKDTRLSPFDAHAFCDDNLDDVDLFCDTEINGECIVFSNSNRQGGIWLDDQSCHIPLEKVREPYDETDWKALEAKLTEHGIGFTRHYGIVAYWN